GRSGQDFGHRRCAPAVGEPRRHVPPEHVRAEEVGAEGWLERTVHAPERTSREQDRRRRRGDADDREDDEADERRTIAEEPSPEAGHGAYTWMRGSRNV